MASNDLEMYRTPALPSTPSLRWHGPLVQTAQQSFSISVGWPMRVYLQSKLWVRDGRLRHPDDLNDLVDYWRHVVASGQPGEIEGRLRRSDGVYRWFLFRATPSLD